MWLLYPGTSINEERSVVVKLWFFEIYQSFEVFLGNSDGGLCGSLRFIRVSFSINEERSVVVKL